MTDPYRWGLSAQMTVQMSTPLRGTAGFPFQSFLLPDSSVVYEVSLHLTKGYMSQVRSFLPGNQVKMYTYKLWRIVSQERCKSLSVPNRKGLKGNVIKCDYTVL